MNPFTISERSLIKRCIFSAIDHIEGGANLRVGQAFILRHPEFEKAEEFLFNARGFSAGDVFEFSIWNDDSVSSVIQKVIDIQSFFSFFSALTSTEE